MPARSVLQSRVYFFFFFFNDTATTEIYTLSLHDALPISGEVRRRHGLSPGPFFEWERQDRKSTRLNSSHGYISYAVFCLKKKNIHTTIKEHYEQPTHLLMPRAHSTPS